MLISVIMSTYDEPLDWIKKSTYSIINQTYKDLEFIIICDNPNNINAINYLKYISTLDNRIKIFINSQNMGLIYSLNLAISKSTGTYIARMDADDISRQDRLEKQLQYIQDNNLDLIGSNITLFTDDNGVFKISNKLRSHNNIQKLIQIGTIGIVHPTFFGRKEVFLSTKGYNQQALYAEDMEFLAHAISLGYKLGNTLDVLLDCRYSYNSTTKLNSYIMYLTTLQIKESYLKFLKGNSYEFKGVQNTECISNAVKEKFMKKQIMQTKARESLKNNNIFLFLLYILCTFYYAPVAMLNTFKITLITKLLEIKECKNLND